jgi:integrase
MGNFVFFNPETKNRFIDESNYSVNTKQTIAQMFNVTKEIEEFYNKDIYEMSDSEIAEVLDNFKSTSYETVYSKTSYLASYVDWCIKEKYLETNINNVRLHLGSENMKRYVEPHALKYKILPKEEILALTYGSNAICNNAQDAAIIISLFIGGRGRQEKEYTLEELRNLKWEDCSEVNNTVTFTRDNGDIRTVQVKSYVLEILKDANAQDRYLKNNGEVSDWMQAKKNTEIELFKTGYILRPTIQGEYGKITSQTIGQRLRKIREFYGNPYITINNIWLSGMVEYAKQIKQEKGADLTKEDYEEVCRQFGQDKVYWYKTKQRIEKYI